MSAESLEELRSFITLLMEKILTKCHVLEGQSQENRIIYTNHLVNLTMEGLSDIEGAPADLSTKYTDKICEDVVSELKEKLRGRRLLDIQIYSRDPDFDATIVQSVLTHTKAQFAKKDHACRSILGSAVVEHLNMSAESLEELRSFITLLMEKILTKCHVLEGQSQENRIIYTNHLVNLTMEGLSDIEGVPADLSTKYTDKICEDVVSELKEKLRGRRLLDIQIYSRDPDFDATIVQSVLTHTKAQFAKKDHACRSILGFVASTIALGIAIYKVAEFFKSAVMEHVNMSIESLEDRPETVIQEHREDSAETRSQSPLPPASSSSEDQLRAFVTLLMVKILTERHVLEGQSQENRIIYIKHLVNLTIEGLSNTEGVSLKMKYINKICEAVVSDLKKKFCGRRLMDTQIFSQDADFNAAIAQSVQTHTKDLLTRLAKREHSYCSQRDLLQGQSQENRIIYTLHLVNLTMEGLGKTEGVSLDMKYNNEICEAVVSDLKKRICDGQLLDFQDFLAAIVQSVQTHINAQLAKEQSCSLWAADPAHGQLLTRCRAHEDLSQEERAAYTERMVKQTMEGLWHQIHQKDYINKNIVKELREELRTLLELVVFAQDSVTDAIIPFEEDPISLVALPMPCFSTQSHACDFCDGRTSVDTSHKRPQDEVTSQEEKLKEKNQ
ncbi:hypothetical protein INR49_002812, partial [Caranx melampygus]